MIQCCSKVYCIIWYTFILNIVQYYVKQYLWFNIIIFFMISYYIIQYNIMLQCCNISCSFAVGCCYAQKTGVFILRVLGMLSCSSMVLDMYFYFLWIKCDKSRSILLSRKVLGFVRLLQMASIPTPWTAHSTITVGTVLVSLKGVRMDSTSPQSTTGVTMLTELNAMWAQQMHHQPAVQHKHRPPLRRQQPAVQHNHRLLLQRQLRGQPLSRHRVKQSYSNN